MAKVETTVTFERTDIVSALTEKARAEISKDASKTAGSSSAVEFIGEGESLQAIVKFKTK